MTRKDYIKFAEMFNDVLTDTQHYEQRERTMTRILVKRTADIFRAENDNFDLARFLKACGVES